MKIYNAKINTMKSGEKPIEKGWIEIKDGIIQKICHGAPTAVKDEDIDAGGQLMIPGFIDAHCHLGIIGNGVGFESDDCNEETDPFMPHLRVLDAVNPFDFCFEEARKRGITSVVTCPGSANAAGGEIIAIKTAGRRADDMLIKKVGIKFALGENPKYVYNDKGETPITRMATAAIIREGLYKAKKYSEDVDAYRLDSEENDLPEYDIKCEALIPLIKREIKAQFHCHRADDIFTAIRIAKEFDLDYTLIHATEGHLVADILAQEQAQAVVGPIFGDRCKPELKSQDISNAGKLFAAGMRPAICTDHPETPIQYLPVTAALAVRGGLPYNEALRAVTVYAAQISGISDRTGTIEVGKDADIQLYSGNPLDIMSAPSLVLISGERAF